MADNPTINIEQNIMEIFMGYLSPEPLYAFGYEFAAWASVVIAPVLLVLALAVRATGDSVNAISGKTNWLDTIRDIIIGVLSWGAYLGFMLLVKDFFDVLDNAIGKSEAYANIFNSMSKLTKSVEMEGFNLSDALSSLSLLLAYLFFFLTYLLSIGLLSFLNIGHTAIYCVAFIWGLIAISVSLSKYANLMKGWAIMMAVVFVWPLVEGLLFYLAGTMVQSGADQTSDYMLTMAGTEYGAKTFIYSLWGVLNCLIMALAFVAPLLTYSLVSNSGSVAGAVASFGAAGLAAAGGLSASLTGKGLNKVPFAKADALKVGSAAGKMGLGAAGSIANGAVGMAGMAGKAPGFLRSKLTPKPNINKDPLRLNYDTNRLESGALTSQDRQKPPSVIPLSSSGSSTHKSSKKDSSKTAHDPMKKKPSESKPLVNKTQAPKIHSKEELMRIKKQKQARRGVFVDKVKKSKQAAKSRPVQS